MRLFIMHHVVEVQFREVSGQTKFVQLSFGGLIVSAHTISASAMYSSGSQLNHHCSSDTTFQVFQQLFDLTMRSKRAQRRPCGTLLAQKPASMRPYHLRQELEHAPPLVDDIQELLRRPNAPDDNLVAPLGQAGVRLVAELGQRHP